MNEHLRSSAVEMNAPVVERLLREPPQPEVDGGLVLRVLKTRGHRSGQPRRTPVGVVRRGGQSYLVSPEAVRGWVRNLDADPRCALVAGGRHQERMAVRATPEEAVGAVVLYLEVVQAPWAREAFPFPPDPPASAVREGLQRIAVFRLVDRTTA